MNKGDTDLSKKGTVEEFVNSAGNSTQTIKPQKPSIIPIMIASRKAVVEEYREQTCQVEYTKSEFKDDKRIGIGCVHQAFIRNDFGMMKLTSEVFEKDANLLGDTYYIEKGGQKYMVFRNVKSTNPNIPDNSFTLMKLPDNQLNSENLKNIITTARTEGIDGENSILINNIEELEIIVKGNAKLETDNRVCSVVSDSGLIRTYSENFKKGCENAKIPENEYKEYLPEENENQNLEFRTEKEIKQGRFIMPIGKDVIKSVDKNSSKEIFNKISVVTEKMDSISKSTTAKNNTPENSCDFLVDF